MTMKAPALVITFGLLVACIGGCPSAADEHSTAAANPPPSTPAKDRNAEAEPAAHGHDHDHAEDGAAGEHAGCIYAEGEQGGDPSCPGGGGEPEPPTQSEGHFGAAFALTDPVPLSEAIEKAGEDPVLVKGEVEAVCQKKGCWMVIKDGAVSARVLMQGHGFAVPMDARGKQAIVEGKLTSRTFTEAQVKHLEKDGGGDPDSVSGTRTEHVVTATGVSIGNA